MSTKFIRAEVERACLAKCKEKLSSLIKQEFRLVVLLVIIIYRGIASKFGLYILFIYYL